MQGFFKRLDRLVDVMIDTEAMLGPQARLKPVPIKVIFDNLRCYTVLGFMWLGVKFLCAEPTWWPQLASVTLAAVLGVLSLLVFLQTSLIAISGAFGAVAALLPPRTAVEFRKGIRSKNRLFWGAVVGLALTVMAISVMIAGALASAFVRAGAL